MIFEAIILMKVFDKSIDSWIKDIPYELAFWNNVWKKSRGMKDRASYGKAIKLDGFDAARFLASQTDPVVLDVGCLFPLVTI